MRNLAFGRFWLLGFVFCYPANLFGDVATELVIASRSPEEIKRFVDTHHSFQWQPLWKGLNIGDTLSLPNCEARASAPPDCSATLLKVERPRQTIVILRHESEMAEVYLRFFDTSPTDGGERHWKLAGHYEPFVKSFPPRHRLVTFGKTLYLCVTSQGNAGSGLSSEGEDWLDLSDLTDFQPVFGYNMQGNNTGPLPGSISREVHGSIMLKNRPVPKITVTYEIVFSIETDTNAKPIRLGARHDKAVYSRAVKQKFEFNEKHSTASEDLISNLYLDLDSEITNEELLHYNFANFKKIAAGKDSEAKRWFAAFLQLCQDTSEKRQLWALISSTR